MIDQGKAQKNLGLNLDVRIKPEQIMGIRVYKRIGQNLQSLPTLKIKNVLMISHQGVRRCGTSATFIQDLLVSLSAGHRVETQNGLGVNSSPQPSRL